MSNSLLFILLQRPRFLLTFFVNSHFLHPPPVSKVCPYFSLFFLRGAGRPSPNSGWKTRQRKLRKVSDRLKWTFMIKFRKYVPRWAEVGSAERQRGECGYFHSSKTFSLSYFTVQTAVWLQMKGGRNGQYEFHVGLYLMSLNHPIEIHFIVEIKEISQ